MSPTDFAFGERLRGFRERAGIQQQELAKQLGKSRNTISAWERSLYLPETRDAILRLADVLDLSPIETDQLLFAASFPLEHEQTTASPFRPLYQLRGPAADFAGRVGEIDQLLPALRHGQPAVISGMGGVGKTELAMAVGHRLTDVFRDARILIDMRGTSKRPLPPTEAMAMVINVFRPDVRPPDDPAQIQQFYTGILSGKRALIVLDNAADARQVTPLAPPAGCALLITSRRRIAVPGAISIELDTLPDDPARALLKHLAGPRRTTSLQLDRVAALCGRLPLALRIAGTFLRTHPDWPLDDYLEALSHERLARLKQDDLDVAATLSMSYEQLKRDNTVLAQHWLILSVFPAAFDRGAAAAALNKDSRQALDLLSELVNYSLVEWNVASGHYQLHDLVRFFAETRLNNAERRAAHRRAGYYYQRDKQRRYILEAIYHLQHAGEHQTAARLATFDTSAIIGLGRTHALQSLLEQFKAEQLDAEQAAAVNIALGQVYTLLGETRHARSKFNKSISQAAALPRSSTGKRELLARAYRGMGELLEHESPREALIWLQRGLRHVTGLDNSQLQADLLIKAGGILIDLGDFTKAQKSVERGMALLPRGSSQLRAAALLNLGDVFCKQGNSRKGNRLTRRALEISRRLGDYWLMLKLEINLATETEIAGDWQEAASLYQEAVKLAHQLGTVRYQALLECNLGLLKTNQGDYESAEDHLRIALDLARTHNLKGHLVNVLCNLADLKLRQADGAAALPALAEAEQLAMEIGYKPQLPEIYRSLAQVRLLHSEPKSGLALANNSVRLAEKFGDELELGKSLRVLGKAQWIAGQRRAALASFERSVALLADRESYEAARTKAEWGEALVEDGSGQATQLLREARAVFERLGARFVRR